MARATEIETHVHGLINLAVSDASFLVLAPEPGGRYALTADEVGARRLQGAPLVILAACRAAHTAPTLHEPFSLPVSFIQAGARTVLAATVDVPDTEAGTFFDAVRERIRSGQPAARALRDVRMQWLQRNPSSWVRSVLVFD
jgi:CHAT domain-containing protein